MTIGERLLKLRKKRNLSQEDLANVLDVSRQTVSKWETDQTTPDFDKIVPLCEYFGITSDELLSGKKDIVESNKEEKKGIFARNIAVSVSLYIISIVFIIFFSTVLEQEIIGVSLFFITCAIATGVIIYTAIRYGDKEEKAKKEKSAKNEIAKQVCDIIGLIGVIVYFLVSFATGAWYITWIIFIIIGLCNSIVRLLFNVKKCENNNCEGESEDE